MKFKATKENMLKPRPCPTCGQMKSKEYLEEKYKKKGAAVKKALEERRLNGETIGRPTKVDPIEIITMRNKGATFREIAEKLKVSNRTISRAISSYSTSES